MKWDRVWLYPKSMRLWVVAVVPVVGALLVSAQNPELQQKVAEVKEAMAANKQAIAQYTWQEQVTVSLKGDVKKQEHFQVRIGPDGKPQKQSLDAPQAPAAPSGGRLKQHVVEKKKDEYTDYVNQIKALIQQYVPPEKAMLEQAAQQGNVALGPAGGAPGQYQLVLSNYVKPGDKMTLLFDKAQKALVSVTIASFLSDPKDAVNVSVTFAAIPGGPNHVASESIDGVSKQLTIVIANSLYQHL
jgi:Tfp pilus assembly protein PilW